MTHNETVHELVQEIHDLLDASTVGLYELLWQLNTPGQTLSIQQRRHIARQALEVLLADGDLAIVRLHWPEAKPLDQLNLNELTESSWDPDDDGYYIGLHRIDISNEPS